MTLNPFFPPWKPQEDQVQFRKKKFQISLLDSFKTREIAIHGGVGDIKKKPFIDAKWFGFWKDFKSKIALIEIWFLMSLRLCLQNVSWTFAFIPPQVRHYQALIRVNQFVSQICLLWSGKLSVNKSSLPMEK